MELSKNKKLIIAGPCSAESEEQLIRTATAIKELGKVDVLRAGIWKPRTNPGNYEGAGIKGLNWLVKAKELTGLPIGTEVAEEKHVEDAMHYELDLLWIGARTTVNPFSVQKIANALGNTNVPVLVKNPINPDLKLWVGAVERLQKAGVTNIGLIHRGFSTYGEEKYRNVPLWQIPIEMKRIFPDLPMICDPSHIMGRKEGLDKIAQRGLDLDYQGVMIETHIDPENAWTDKEQQISPSVLGQLIDKLVWKATYSDSPSFQAQLEAFRGQINRVDEELITLLAQRMTIVKEIGALKKLNNVTVLQSNRWEEIVTGLTAKGESLGIDAAYVKKLLEVIHLESIRVQNSLKEKTI